MAVSDLNQRKHDLAIQAVEGSSLPEHLKEDLVDALASSLEATNGMSQDEKLQATTENIFSLTRLIAVSMATMSTRAASWREVAIAYKWALVIMFSVLCTVLLLRPELAGLVESLSHSILSR